MLVQLGGSQHSGKTPRCKTEPAEAKIVTLFRPEEKLLCWTRILEHTQNKSPKVCLNLVLQIADAKILQLIKGVCEGNLIYKRWSITAVFAVAEQFRILTSSSGTSSVDLY